jgi:hypothetical protein
MIAIAFILSFLGFFFSSSPPSFSFATLLVKNTYLTILITLVNDVYVGCSLVLVIRSFNTF